MEAYFRRSKSSDLSFAMPDDLPNLCLNCAAPLSGNYCSNCGQSTATRRYSLKGFVAKDVLQSLWHIDRNNFKTLFQVMISPGNVALNNIAGKRIRYYPIITILLLLAGLYLFAFDNGVRASEEHPITIGVWDVSEFLARYQQWILLASVPFVAGSSWIVFQKCGFNYAEHLVIACHYFAGVLAWACVTSLLPHGLPHWCHHTITVLWTLYWLRMLWQTFRKPYKTLWGWLWRVAVFFVFSIALFALMLTIVVWASRPATDLQPELVGLW